MDFSSNLVIDLLLNVAGFLVAGALALTVYAIYQRRLRPTATSPEEPAPEEPTPVPRVSIARPIRNGTGEFITLGATPDSSQNTMKTTGHSRRAQVIQAAREMINAGATDGEVRSTVPVSDAELAVLNIGRKKQQIEER
ncbi:MAG: hypothetical protein KOO62_13160 [candidate division Zixibacteria bacterium]|nr:hypothetical protein [candidate division Zixibacteria bacterium]